MPFESEAQRGFMHARHPRIAKRWEEEKKRKIKKAQLKRLKEQKHG
jgi:hypothetical protein